MDHLVCFNNRNMTFTTLWSMFHTCLPMDPAYSVEFCSQSSSLYLCPNTTKCISKHRLLNGILDCPDGADEFYSEPEEVNLIDRFYCASNKTYLSRVLLRDGIDHCGDGQDEIGYVQQRWSYAKLCDGLFYHKENGNETDETDCHAWPCSNVYTRCNGMWSCLNGADELDCNPEMPCYPGRYECISPQNFSVICLPWNRANDGIIDCLGATDERAFCREFPKIFYGDRYRCWNESKCVSIFSIEESIEQCRFDRPYMIENERSPTVLSALSMDSDMAEKQKTIHAFFQLKSSTYFSYEFRPAVESDLRMMTSPPLSNVQRVWYCQRGIMIRRGPARQPVCLCPPSYERRTL